MILRWKQSGPVLHVAVWQSRSLALHYEGSAWRVTVDDVLVTTDKGAPARWSTLAAAKEAADAAVERRIIALGAVVHAQQRPLREVRRAQSA